MRAWNSLTKEFELDTECEKLVGTSLGPIQRLFGVGVLRVQTSFAPLPAFMLDVADVKQLHHDILVLRNQAWDRHVRSYNQAGPSGQLRAAS